MSAEEENKRLALTVLEASIPATWTPGHRSYQMTM
jgi:hypothetical protein